MVGNLHLGKDRGAVVCDSDVSVRRDEDLVQSSRSLDVVSQCSNFLESNNSAYQRALDKVRDGLGRQNVGLDRIVAVLPRLLALTVPKLAADFSDGISKPIPSSPHTL